MKTLEKALKIGRNIAGSALIGATALLSATAPTTAKADLITIANKPYRESSQISNYPVIIDANHPEYSIEYDSGIDHELNTSESTSQLNFTTYQNLNSHLVDQNQAPKPQIGDTYEIKFGTENKLTLLVNFTNTLILSSYNLNNTNGVTDYEWVMNVDTNANGSYTDSVDITETGLLSEVWASQDKTLGSSWEVENITFWNNRIRTIRIKRYTRTNNINIILGAGLALGAGYVASQLKKKSNL